MNIPIVSENLEKDGVTVVLEWTQENDTFYVSVTPHVASTLLTSERMRVHLNVSFDILYNVSVLATPNCGQGNNTAASIELHYCRGFC